MMGFDFHRLTIAFIGNEDEFLWRGCFYAFLLLVNAQMHTFLVTISIHLLVKIGLQIRTALISVIYRKVNTASYSLFHIFERNGVNQWYQKKNVLPIYLGVGTQSQ